MRIALACLFVAALSTHANADAKIKQLLSFYEKEGGTCRKNARGVTVVVERGQPVASGDQELADDLAALAKIQSTVQSHCDELTSMIEFLRADPAATYKQIQQPFAEHDDRVRKGRLASRQALADAQPLISRAVPRINKLIAKGDAAARLSIREQKAVDEKEQKASADKAAADKAAADKAAADKSVIEKATKASGSAPVQKPPVEKKPVTKFPSGRAVELPAPIEAWTASGSADTDIAEYAFGGATGSVIVRVRTGVSCEQIRTSAMLLAGRTAAQPVAVSAELKPLKAAWMIGWQQDNHQIRALCVTTKRGVVVGRTEVSVVGNAPLDAALARMVAAHLRP